MSAPLIILAPPRSFTSIVCAMLGQHPQMYGLPEVNLFIGETLAEVIGKASRMNFIMDGLLRTVAELFAGEQTVETILLAEKWLAARFDAESGSVFKELAKKIEPKIPVEKSPATPLKVEFMVRARRTFPDGRYIHLLRHPRSHGESLLRTFRNFGVRRLGGVDLSTGTPIVDPQKIWFSFHVNIITFLASLDPASYIRLRGEDLLDDPDTHLRTIADWLGLRTDSEAIEAMKHPEWSPFAHLGPPNARFGNDPDYLRNPAFKRGQSRPVSLEDPLPWRNDGVGLSREVKELAYELGYT